MKRREIGLGKDSDPAPPAHVEALHTDDATVNDGAEVRGQEGTVHPSDWVTFSAEYQGSKFAGSDPQIISYEHFSDNEYRVIISDGGWVLRKTPDFSDGSYTTISTDIRPTANAGDLQDHIVLSDGTFVLYDGRGSPDDTYAYTGSDLTNLSTEGKVIDGWTDCGVYYEEDAGTIHLYPEGTGGSTAAAPTLEHFTTPDDDLLNSTQQSTALDISSENWETGDAEFLSLGDYVYGFIDRYYSSKGTSSYRIAVMRSDDLDNWTLVSQNITGPIAGGDMSPVLSKSGTFYWGMTEFSQGSQEIGLWKLYPSPVIGDVSSPGESVTVNVRAAGGGVGTQIAEFFEGPDRNWLKLKANPAAAGKTQGLELQDAEGNDLGGVIHTGQNPKLFARSGQQAIIEAVGGGMIKVAAGNVAIDGPGNERLKLDNEKFIETATNGYQIPALSSAPASPPSGQVVRVIADGTNWDPDSDGNAEAGYVLPDGTFVETVDFGTTL